MNEIQLYEILGSLPPYGPMYIPVTGNNKTYFSEGFPVRFFKSDGTDWVANFKPGFTDLKEVFKLNDSPYLLVIAYGSCYLMDPNYTAPIKVFGASYKKVFKTENEQIILQDDTDLTVVEKNGDYWHSERISLDGLKITDISGNIVSGLAVAPTYHQDEWVKFTYNVATKVLVGGMYTDLYKKKKL